MEGRVYSVTNDSTTTVRTQIIAFLTLFKKDNFIRNAQLIGYNLVGELLIKL
jgi:hypothetical protein